MLAHTTVIVFLYRYWGSELKSFWHEVSTLWAELSLLLCLGFFKEYLLLATTTTKQVDWSNELVFFFNLGAIPCGTLEMRAPFPVCSAYPYRLHPEIKTSFPSYRPGMTSELCGP